MITVEDNGFDVRRLRDRIPSLASGIAHFDGPGGTQTPRSVIDAIAGTLSAPLSNRGTTMESERNADTIVRAFRAAYGDFLGIEPEGVVYGRSATQLCYDFSRHLARTWQPGDEVVVTRLDHDANIRPWIQAAESVGAEVRWIDLDPITAELDEASIAAAITPSTRLVAVTAASNVVGTMPDVRAIADAAHAVGALVYVDGVHHAAHARVDIAVLGADLYMCSPYKFLGPHCGVLAASPSLLAAIHPDKLLPSTDDVPERFEFGTLPYEIMAGATAAVDVLADAAPGGATTRTAALSASMHAIDAHETTLRRRVEIALAEFDVRVWSRARKRTPTLLMSTPGRSARAVQESLAERNIQVPAGNFYAVEAFSRLGIDEPALRIGIAPYTTVDEVDRLLEGLAAALTG